ncbi:serine/threonine-protein kinase [Glaciihabitans tibetensis]|uniref:non-specific serine/threonine protein kinase n=1 Tax=Glaciihabitans tibetensis TaxID=1266600 RepID=A0A2T0VCM2_9MICO|nr:protein kinase [Glaciihabitans tibetensis]PRY67928.1 serine/threonine-protein kinase [Glaciihabitans tibetensis]
MTEGEEAAAGDSVPSGGVPTPGEAAGPVGLLSGRYQLGGLLGTGGTASVFRAVDTLTGATVAVKVLHPRLSTDDAVRTAFFEEAMAVATIQHPNIVSVHAVGVHDAGGVDMAWIAEDLAEGLSLTEYLETAGTLSIVDALAVTEGTLLALAAAHEVGLVHRDISPNNLIVNPQPGGRIEAADVRLVDFGLADAAGQATVGDNTLLATRSPRATARHGGSTHSGSASPALPAGVVGNANYLSPEQARGEAVTERSDLYQTGAVLYTLLTGQVPYPRADVRATVAAHASAPPPVPSSERVAVPRSIDRFVVTAMATRPGERFSSAAAMLEALRAVAAPLRAAAQVAPVDHTEIISGAGQALLSELGADLVERGPDLDEREPGLDAPTTVLPGGTRSRGVISPPRAAETAGSWDAAQAGAAAPAHWYADIDASESLPRPISDRRRLDNGALGRVAVAVAIVGLLAWGVISYQMAPSAPAPLPEASAEASVVPLNTSAPTPTNNVPPPVAEPVAKRVPVPQVAGGTLDEATATLAAATLSVGEVIEWDSVHEAGRVLGSDPAAGSELDENGTVAIIVASGSNSVPSVAGTRYASSLATLRDAGFTVGNATVVPADAQITGTTPAAGESHPLGTLVALLFTAPSATPTPTPRPTVVPSPSATPSPTPTPVRDDEDGSAAAQSQSAHTRAISRRDAPL